MDVDTLMVSSKELSSLQSEERVPKVPLQSLLFLGENKKPELEARVQPELESQKVNVDDSKKPELKSQKDIVVNDSSPDIDDFLNGTLSASSGCVGSVGLPMLDFGVGLVGSSY